MGFQKLIPGVHFVVETWAARFFRRILRDEQIITVWCAVTGRWLLMYWVDKANGAVNEIDDLGATLDAITPELVEDLRRTRKPTTVNALRERILRQQKDAARAISDSEAEQRLFREWMRKKGIPPIYYEAQPIIRS